MSEARPAVRFTFAADGVRLAYAVTGRGPPLLRAPTWLGHLENDWDGPIFGHWLRELSRSHTLVHFDARGVGMSERAAAVSFDGWVQDMATVADAAGLDRFGVVAGSHGCAVAIAYAAARPERVERMFLTGACCRGTLQRSPTPREVEDEALLLRLIELGWERAAPDFRQVFTTRIVPDATPAEREWFSDGMRLAASAANALRYLRMAQALDVREQARGLRCEVLLMHALRDALIPYEEGRLAAALIPRAAFVTLQSANHFILEHEPAWEHVCNEFRRFMVPTAGEPAPSPAFDTLTRREREVLGLIAEGCVNDEISARLGLSAKTVRNHITHVFAKLGVSSRAQAIVRAREAGFARRH